MIHVHLDYETRSELELGGVKGHGLHNYATHPTTKILMLAWAIDNEKPQLWLPHEGPMPARLEKILRDGCVSAYSKDFEDYVEFVAYNSPFERYITREQLGIDIPINRWQDPQASARYLSLPASLEDVGLVLRLPKEFLKDKRGETLMDKFSFPQTRTKKQLKANPELSPVYFHDHISHPEDFAAYGEYCKQDIVTEREVARRLNLLKVFPLPERERKIWIFDQKVNDRGIPTDIDFVQKAFKIAERNKEEKLEEQNHLTGLENANSAAQLMPWAQERGYPLSNLRKSNIELVLKDKEVALTDECRKVLNARMEASSTSYKKLQAIMRNVSEDGRLRSQFVYMGSSRCGRWSGNAVQLHNLARPDGTFEDLENVIKARDFIYAEDYDSLKTAFKKVKVRPTEDEFYSPLIITKNLIRTVFVAPEGKRYNVADLASIETRVGAWVAQCGSLLKVFEDDLDAYLSFAVKLTGIPYEKLYYDLKKNPDKAAKAVAKLWRQLAKPGVLGAIYRLGGGGWAFDKNGDRIKTGLWGYAESMGIEMSQEQAHEVVKIFRESYPEICANGYQGGMKGIWVQLEDAVMDVLNGQKTVRKLGPEGCIVIDKVTIAGRNPMLRIKLPSGRYLHYLDASIETTKMPWQRKNQETGEMEDVYRPAFCYYGQNQDTKSWERIVSHGGKIFENCVQGLARDVLADKLLEFEDIGLETVAHVHDEGICLSDDDPFAPGVLEMEAIMNTPVVWAPTLPLGSDGFESSFYHK